jgi:uncharacterized membrane protein YkoI
MIRIAMLAVLAVAVAALSAGIGIAARGGDTERPITGSALARASAAALEHTGGGRVTETELGDEEGYYEVEVTLPDGRQVDVHLDRTFQVVGEAADADGPEDESGSRDDS